MSETKIQINERKIRNGQRRGRHKVKVAQQKIMWEKLTTESKPVLASVLDPNVTYTVKRSTDKNVWYYPTELVDKKFDKVIINEWLKNESNI